MKTLISLLLAAAILPAAFAQNVTIQKAPAAATGANKLTDSSKVIVVGDGGSISATGTGEINATSVAGGSISPTAPLTGGGPISGTVVIGIPKATSSVDGYLFHTDWATFNAKQPAGNYITALTGDATAAGPASSVLTFATVNANVGTFAGIAVNAKGLVTGATALTTLAGYGITDAVPSARTVSTTAPLTGGGALSGNLTLAIPAATSLVNGYLTSSDWTTFNAKQAAGNYLTALTGDVSASGPGSAAATLATVASAGTTGSSTAIPVVTIDAKGRTTSITTAAVVAPAGTLTGTTLASNVVTSSITSVGSTLTVGASGAGSISASSLTSATATNLTLTAASTGTSLVLAKPTGDGTSPVSTINSVVSIGGGTGTYIDYLLTLNGWAANTRDAGIGLYSFTGGSPLVDFISGDSPSGKGRIGRNNLTGAALFVGTGGDTASGFQIGTRDSTPIQFFTADNSRAFITSAGNVGIGAFTGASQPDTLLHVLGAAKITGQITSTVTTGTAPLVIASTTLVANLQAATAAALATARNINGVAFDGTASITVPADAGTLTGTDLASNVITSHLTSFATVTTFTLSGTFNVQNAGNNKMVVQATSTDAFLDAPNTAGGIFMRTLGANPITFKTNSQTALTIDGTSQLLTAAAAVTVGSTTDATASAAALFSNGGITALKKIWAGTGGFWGASVTAPASTDLTLTGGTTSAVAGAAVVFGNGAAGGALFSAGGQNTSDGAWNPIQWGKSGNYRIQHVLSTFSSVQDQIMGMGYKPNVAAGSGDVAAWLQIEHAFKNGTGYDTEYHIDWNGPTAATRRIFQSDVSWGAGFATDHAEGYVRSAWAADLFSISGNAADTFATHFAFAAPSLQPDLLISPQDATKDARLRLTQQGGTTGMQLLVSAGGTYGAGISALTSIDFVSNSLATINTFALRRSANSGTAYTNLLNIVASASTARWTFNGATDDGSTPFQFLGNTAMTGQLALILPSSTYLTFSNNSGDSAIYAQNNALTPSSSNFTFDFGTNYTIVNAPNSGGIIYLRSNNVATARVLNTALSVDLSTASTSTTTGSLINAGGFGNAGDFHNGGNALIDTAGKTLSVKSGANAAAGTVTLVAGAATITSTAIDANTVILFSEKTAGGTPGVYQPLAAVSSGSAAVTSAATDTSTYNWVAVKVN